jgi:hypothetical protein
LLGFHSLKQVDGHLVTLTCPFQAVPVFPHSRLPSMPTLDRRLPTLFQFLCNRGKRWPFFGTYMPNATHELGDVGDHGLNILGRYPRWHTRSSIIGSEYAVMDGSNANTNHVIMAQLYTSVVKSYGLPCKFSGDMYRIAPVLFVILYRPSLVCSASSSFFAKPKSKILRTPT